MKHLLLATALGLTSVLAAAPGALAQDTPVKPQLPTGPPMVPPPTRPTPAPTQPAPQPQPAQPQQPQPTQPVSPSSTIDDDNRPAQPLPGAPAQQPVPATPKSRNGIDDDGRPAQELPRNGTVPGATTQAERLPSKYFIYGNLSLGLTSNSLNGVFYNIGASPALGYRLNSRFAVGPGIVYSHSRYTIPQASRGPGAPSGISANNLGLKIFGQAMIIKQFFVHAEYEVTRAEILSERFTGPSTLIIDKRTATVRTPLLGIGYRQSLGNRVASDIAVLYNFNDGLDANIYGQPVIRFSFLFDVGK